MGNYMKVTYTASWIIIIALILIIISAVVVAVKETVFAYMERKYGCEEVNEFTELETANEAYNRLFVQYEDVFDQNNHLIAEKATLERKCRRLQNTCNDLEAENARLKAERESTSEKASEPKQEDYTDPTTFLFGHMETPNE